jgi:hypothetical protein
VGIHIHGPSDNNHNYGIHIVALNWATNEMCPRVADLISATEYFHRNNCGLIEVTEGITVSDKPATQNGAAEMVVQEDGTVTLTIADGDNAAFFRSVLITARDRGVIHNNWILSVQGGVTLSCKDPATMPPPYDLAFAQDQVDYNQRL